MKEITLTPLDKVDKTGFLASYLTKRSQQEPEIIQHYNNEIECIKLSHKIKQLREDINLTQQELADRMGKSQASIGRIENGTTNPTYKTLEEIAAATNTRLVVDFVPIKN